MGPKYAVKYHTAAENALSHCYRSCLELLIENGLQRLGDRPMSLIFVMSLFISLVSLSSNWNYLISSVNAVLLWAVYIQRQKIILENLLLM